MDSEIYRRILDIKHDSTHGASWLAREALEVIKLAAASSPGMPGPDFLDHLESTARELLRARPGMAPIANHVARLMWEVREQVRMTEERGRLSELVITLADRYIRDSQQAVKRAAEHAAGILAGTGTVVTCSYSSTIIETFAMTKCTGREIEVIIAESRVGDKKYGELAAAELASIGVPARLTPDETVLDHIAGAGMVMVGADSILSDGSVVNGVPSYRVAEAAGQSGIPLYAICERAKFNPRRTELEEGFDLIPSLLITGIITEDGIVTPGDVIEHAREMENYIAALAPPALTSLITLQQGENLQPQ